MNNRNSSNMQSFGDELKTKGFKAYEIIEQSHFIKSYSRKGIFKICLTDGKSAIHYADKGIQAEGDTLFFGNPNIPYSWEFISENNKGYACLFSEDFLKSHNRSESLQESPLFKIGGTPVFHLNREQKSFIASLFKKMIADQDSEYAFKNDLIRSYIDLIIHEALKMQPSENYFKHQNAATRISSMFLELLERQFPIESVDHPLQLRTASGFAKNLSVHVNHLNRAVKEITGKPTSSHISERIVAEAKALLQHTEWSIADIAHALGFEYLTYFNNYYKRVSGSVPSAIRQHIV